MEIVTRPLQKEVMRMRLMAPFGENFTMEILESPFPFVLPMMDYDQMVLNLFILY